jgi:hypothetical protein
MQSSIRFGGLSIPNNHLSRRRLPTIPQLIQLLFRRDKIGGTEPLREAIIYWPEVSDRIGGMPLTTQQAREAQCSTNSQDSTLRPSSGAVRAITIKTVSVILSTALL